jgi:hypothetical protein
MLVITETRETMKRRLSKSWLFLLFIILFVVFVRIRLLEFPLERDEGEYAYMGQLILQGVPPYSEAYNMKFPGTYLMYAGIMAVFGQTTQGIHLGLILVNCASILLVYLLVRKIVDDFPAAIAGGTYAVLSLSSSVFGFAAHATHFVILPALGGTLLLLHALKKEKSYLYFLSGALLGMSVIMKQHGVFFVLFGGIYVIYHHLSYGPARSHEGLNSLQASKLAGFPMKGLLIKLGTFSLGAVLPIIITFLWLYASGVFPRFWFWTFEYASKYVTQNTFSEAFSEFKFSSSAVVNGFFIFWILSALGLVVIFFHREVKTYKVFVLLFVLFSFLSICPGFYFSRHYFITLLPAVAVLIGVFIDFLNSGRFTFLKASLSKLIGAGIFIAAATVGVIHEKDYFFDNDPVRLCGLIYSVSPLRESVEIAKFIEARTTPNDRIAVFGSEPQIFFYAKRRSSTGYIYTYNLMETHEYVLPMQKEMAAEVEASKPKFIVDVRVAQSWLQHEKSETFIFRWLDDYIANNYNLVGIADIIRPDLTVYKWYDDTKNYRVQSLASLLIFERR